MGYGGAVSTWCSKYGVEPAKLPHIVHHFEKEQQELRRIDAERHPELVQKATALGKSRPDVTLQSLLNMDTERRRLDLMASKLAMRHIISAYEHDGEP